MNVPEAPFVLHLPNVMHLATDVAGVSDDDATSLELAAALHPSAAVGGTPTDAAIALIDEIEGMDRDRYAGPVGWIDASGDGEWGLALRSAACSRGNRVRLFAGCGIVADSDPDAELAEAQAKFVPVRDALEQLTAAPGSGHSPQPGRLLGSPRNARRRVVAAIDQNHAASPPSGPPAGPLRSGPDDDLRRCHVVPLAAHQAGFDGRAAPVVAEGRGAAPRAVARAPAGQRQQRRHELLPASVRT